MGKVGSMTVERSLRAIKLDMPIYHTHLLTKERIADTEAKRKKFFRTERYSYLKRPWLNQFLLKQIESGLNDKKWKMNLNVVFVVLYIQVEMKRKIVVLQEKIEKN